MFLSLDFLYVPARDFAASVRYYTGQLGGDLIPFQSPAEVLTSFSHGLPQDHHGRARQARRQALCARPAHHGGRRARLGRRRDDEREILDDYPDLTEQDIRACLAYAADREQHTMIALTPHEAAV